MNTVNQSTQLSTGLSQERDDDKAGLELSQTPLQALLNEANSGGDQHNGAGAPASDELRNPANFATPGPMTSLLSEPLLANPFSTVQASSAQPTRFNNVQQTQPSTYEVKKHDTLAGIASVHKMDLSELRALNPQIKNIDQIQPGDRITVSRPQDNGNSGDSVTGNAQP